MHRRRLYRPEKRASCPHHPLHIYPTPQHRHYDIMSVCKKKKKSPCPESNPQLAAYDPSANWQNYRHSLLLQWNGGNISRRDRHRWDESVWSVASISFSVNTLTRKGDVGRGRKACENLPSVEMRLYVKSGVSVCKNVSVMRGQTGRQTDRQADRQTDKLLYNLY